VKKQVLAGSAWGAYLMSALVVNRSPRTGIEALSRLWPTLEPVFVLCLSVSF
jgi:hypothetical protein